MFKKISAASALVLALGMAANVDAALLIADDCDGNVDAWTFNYDQNNDFVDGEITFDGDNMNLGVVNFDDVQPTYEVVGDATYTATVAFNNVSDAGAFFTLGVLGSTAQGTIADCDIYEDSGAWYAGIYSGGSYVASAALSAAPTTGTQMVVVAETIEATTVTVTVKDTSENVLATASAGLGYVPPAGLPYLKGVGVSAAIDDFMIEQDGQVVFSDDFTETDASVIAQDWYIDQNPQVGEGSATEIGMRGFNNSYVHYEEQNPGDFSRAQFKVIGGETLKAAGIGLYGRDTTRHDPSVGLNAFGDIDARIGLVIPADTGALFFSPDNNTNEGPRNGVYLVADDSGQTNGVDNPSIHIGSGNYLGVTPSTSVSLNGIWDPVATPEIYLYFQRNGNDFTGWVGTADDGTALAGSIVTETITPNVAAGQIAISYHATGGGNEATVYMNTIDVWDYNTGWTSTTSVSDWAVFQ